MALNNSSLKNKLLEILQEQLNQRIQNAENAIDTAKKAKAQETKSTAGDKHEVGRAMMQIEQEKNEMQLAKAKELQGVLSLIDSDKITSNVGLGSLVKTNMGHYFISIGLGKIMLDNEQYFAVSREAPLAQTLLGKTQGWKGDFRSQEVIIEAIY